MLTKLQNWVKDHPLMAFFGIAYAITWLGSAWYVASLPGLKGAPRMIITGGSSLLWYYGPFLAAVIVTGARGGREMLGAFLGQFRNWKEPAWGWYAFIILYPLGLHLAVVYLAWLSGGPKPAFFQAEGVPSGNPFLTLIILLLIQIFVRGIGEETGWRGFALPVLLSRRGPLLSSLILGLLWAGWHFHPANFPALLTLSGIFAVFRIIGTAFIYTKVYLATKGSIVVAVLFHAFLNLAEFVVPIGIVHGSIPRHLIQIILVGLTGLALYLIPLPGIEIPRTASWDVGIPPKDS